MANAVPVHSKVEEAPEKQPEAPARRVPPPIEGKDHPTLGKWIGNGWRKDH